MKTSINKILPFALSFLLPVINLISNKEILSDSATSLFDYLWRWFVTSITLFILWFVVRIITKKGSVFNWFKITISIFCLLFFVYLFLSYTIFVIPGFKWNFIFKFLFASILFLVIQYALFANENIIRLQLINEQMKTENYKVQLDALRTKVDPHFLFNSLNTLRTMIRNKHEHAEQFVLSLSDFYRETLKYNEFTTIPLKDEIEVLKSYFFLMKSRNEDAVQITISVDERYSSYLIPTLALQTVVENCFKHNAMTAKKPIFIRVWTSDGNTIKISNNSQPKLEVKEQSGFGLTDLNKRYELLNIKDGVITDQTDEIFEVTLKLIAV
ncbi:sensor histidine kinase [Flavobacterium sp. U410]